MRVLTGHINFQEDLAGGKNAHVYDARWEEMTDAELDNYTGDWITEEYTGEIYILSTTQEFWR